MKAHKKEPIAVSAPGNPAVILMGICRQGALLPQRGRKEPGVLPGHLSIHPASGDDINVIIMETDKKKWFMLPGHLLVTRPALCRGSYQPGQRAAVRPVLQRGKSQGRRMSVGIFWKER